MASIGENKARFGRKMCRLRVDEDTELFVQYTYLLVDDAFESGGKICSVIIDRAALLCTTSDDFQFCEMSEDESLSEKAMEHFKKYMQTVFKLTHTLSVN